MHVQNQWENLKQLITTKADPSECVSFNYFEKETYTQQNLGRSQVDCL